MADTRVGESEGFRAEVEKYLKKMWRGGDEIGDQDVNSTGILIKAMDTKERFEQIYHRHFTRLYEMAYRVLLDKDDALDCVHDVMVRLYSRLSALTEEPGGYLTVAMRHELADRLRRMDIATRHARWIADDEEEALSGADQEAESRRERIEAIDSVAAREFTPAVRRVFDAVFRHGRSYAEVAEDLSISQSAVNKHVVTALRILRNHFRNNRI